jgi:hypothetical protein
VMHHFAVCAAMRSCGSALSWRECYTIAGRLRWCWNWHSTPLQRAHNFESGSMDRNVFRKAGVPMGRGRAISTCVACVFEVAGGWLVHERLYWDRANTMRQLGRLPAVAKAATTLAVAFR